MTTAVSRVELQYQPCFRWLRSHFTIRAERSSSGLIVISARKKNAFVSISSFHHHHQPCRLVSIHAVSFSGSSFRNCSALRRISRASSFLFKFHSASAVRLLP